MSRRAKLRKTRPAIAPAELTASATTRSPLRTDRRSFVLGLALIVLVILAYLPTFGAGYVWDDDDHLPQSELQRSSTGLYLIWTKLGATPQYYPLTHTTFWLESQLWGLHPAGYHLINVLLHTANALLLWRVLRCLHLPGAWLAAAVFALHPVHVESVAWISERKNVLSGFFYLAAALCYVRSSGFQPTEKRTAVRSNDNEQRTHWAWYSGAIFFFCCAVLSKTVTASLPAALCLVLWWKHRLDRRQLLQLLPMFVVGFAMGRVTAGMEEWSIGAIGRHWDWTFFERCLIAGRAVWFYAEKLLWPANQMFVYPRWEIDSHAAWQYLFPVSAIVLIIIALLSVRRFGRGPLVAILYFGGTLFPALGFVNVYPMRFSFVADHFQYLASIGLIVLLIAGATSVLSRRNLTGTVRMTAAALLIGTLGVLTWRETHKFQDAETLWASTLARNPRAWLAHTNLGVALEKRGDTNAAASHFRQSLELEPEQSQTQVIWGLMLQRQNKLAEAEALFKDAQKQEPTDPRPHYCLGMLYLSRNEPAAAMAEFEVVLQLDERHEDARLELASLLAKQARIPDALSHYDRAMELNPYALDARQKAATLLSRLGETSSAVDLLLEGLAYGGANNAVYQNNIGVALMRAGRAAEAIKHFARAIAINPKFAEPTMNLGGAHETQGEYDAALRHYRQALQLKPDYAAAQAAVERLERR